MKKILLLLLAISVLVSCGDRKKKKKFSYNNKTSEKVKTTVSKDKISEDPPADLNNKGIGPIKTLDLGDIDQEMVNRGQTHYNRLCTACHLVDKKLIGPALKGVTKKRSPEWIMNLMLNTQQMLKEDPISKKLLEIYKTPMINNNMTEQEAREVLEYLRTI